MKLCIKSNINIQAAQTKDMSVVKKELRNQSGTSEIQGALSTDTNRYDAIE